MPGDTMSPATRLPLRAALPEGSVSRGGGLDHPPAERQRREAPAAVAALSFQVDQRGIKRDRSRTQILPDKTRAGGVVL